jgi:nucleoid DNA-binding protein
MTPYKFKLFIPEVAEDMNMSEADLTKIVDFYYKELRQALIKLKYKKIRVDGLGDFNLRENVVRRKIEKYNRIVNFSKKDTMQDYKLVKLYEEELVDLERGLAYIVEDKQRMKNFYDEKNRSSQNMEQQGENS